MISKEIRFLITHSSIYGLGTVVSRIVAFLMLPLYTRYLTPTDYGVLEAIDVSSGIIGIVVTVGIAKALSRFYYDFVGQKERNRVVSTTYITYFCIACLFAPILYIISVPLAKVLFSSEQYGYFIKIGFASLILGGIIDIGLMYLRLVKRPIIFITITITRLILLISFNVLFIVYFEKGVLGILYSSLIVRGLYASVITTSILWKTRVAFSLSLCKNMLKYGLPMVPSSLANAAVRQSDKYFVLIYLSIGDMGIYGLALKLGNIIHSLITVPFNMAYIPRRFEIMNRNDARETFSKVFTYYIFLVGYIGLSISILTPEILKVMVTPRFMEAGNFIPLIVLSMLIFGCHYHFDFGILYSKKTNYLAYINLFCAFGQVGLNFALIPRFGIFGAIWSSVIILSFQALLLYYFSQKYYPIDYQFGRTFMYIIVAIIFYGLSTQLHTNMLIINVCIKLCILTIFPFAIIKSKIITPTEIIKVREIYTSIAKFRNLKNQALKVT